MSAIDKLLKQNKAWAKKTEEKHPGFFEELKAQQNPKYLWIGCSDSRVPATEIVDLMPGEMFVHRNVANLVIHSDLNCLSVIQYAVEVLKVEHIIVCGHYGCGGVKAALSTQKNGLIDNWICHIKDVYEGHQIAFTELKTEEEHTNLLCELNVKEQVKNLSQVTFIKEAWERGQPLTIHGLIYGVHNGLLKDLGVSLP